MDDRRRALGPAEDTPQLVQGESPTHGRDGGYLAGGANAGLQLSLVER
jgi:hypothetical protein